MTLHLLVITQFLLAAGLGAVVWTQRLQLRKLRVAIELLAKIRASQAATTLTAPSSDEAGESK